MSTKLPKLETGSDKKIGELEKITQDLETGTLETLPTELTSKGWILNINELKIPVPETKYYLTVKYEKTTNGKDFIYYWSDKESKKGMTYKAKLFLNEEYTPRTTKLVDYAKAIDIGVDKSFFIDPKIINPLNENDIENILIGNYEKHKIKKNTQINTNKFKYQTFEDYPDNIKKEAIGIINKNKFLEYLLNSISWKHQGDKETAMLLLLSMASIYIKEPVHQIINAPSGKGKTNLFNSVKKTQPDQYLVDLVSFSVKSLYYGKEYILNNKYNILILDDAKFNIEIIELLKLLLDNDRKEKIHRTVIDGIYKEMELEGIFLGLINRAKDDLDTELANRCYLNSLEDNNNNIKNKILEKNIINIDPFYNKFNFILKCCYQYFIDKEINVYNPFLLFFNANKHDNRNINHYLNLAKGMTFYNFNSRKTIDNITIGNYNDLKDTLNIVVEDFQVQKDKLTDTEKKIINELDKNPENNTNKLLANSLGLNYRSVNENIRGRDNQVGLEAKGYIEVKSREKGQFRQNEYNLVKHYKDNPLNTDLVYSVPSEFIYLRSENPLLTKITIIINYLTSKLVVVSKYIEKKIKKFLENNVYELENYNNLCLMLEDFNNYIKNDENIIYLNSDFNISSEMFIQHNTIVKKYNDEIFNFLSDFIPKNRKVSKTNESSLNRKQKKKNLLDNKTDSNLRYEKANKDLRMFIHKEIYETLKNNGSLTKSNIIKYISRCENDPDRNYYIISKEINFLLDTKCVLEKIKNNKYSL